MQIAFICADDLVRYDQQNHTTDISSFARTVYTCWEKEEHVLE